MDRGRFLRTLHIMGYKKCGENSWKYSFDWLTVPIKLTITVEIINDYNIRVDYNTRVEELYSDDVNNPTITYFSDYQKCIDYLL